MTTETRSLDEALELFSVMDVSSIGESQRSKNFADLLNDWFAVVNEDGIVAYFADEQSALRYRLAEINRWLNG